MHQEDGQYTSILRGFGSPLIGVHFTTVQPSYECLLLHPYILKNYLKFVHIFCRKLRKYRNIGKESSLTTSKQ